MSGFHDALHVKVTSGPARSSFRWPPTRTIAEVKEDLEKAFSLQVAEQKLIHRGKALCEPGRTLGDCGVRDGDRMMVIRVRPDFELDPSYQEVVQLLDQCSPLLSRLREVEVEFSGMEGGFLDPKLQVQALPKLTKRLAAASEGFMRLLEKLDAMRFNDDQKEAKLKRRDVVVTIQAHMDKADALLKRINDQLKNVNG